MSMTDIPVANTVNARLTIVEKDVARLAGIAPDLPEAALSWVRNGSRDDVIDRIAACGKDRIFYTGQSQDQENWMKLRSCVLRPGQGFDAAQAGRYFKLVCPHHRNPASAFPWFIQKAEPLKANDGHVLLTLADAAGFSDGDVVAMIAHRYAAVDTAQIFGVEKAPLVLALVRRTPSALFQDGSGNLRSGNHFKDVLPFLAEYLAASDVFEIFEKAMSNPAPTDRETFATLLRNSGVTARRRLGQKLLKSNAASARDGGVLVLSDLAVDGDVPAQSTLSDQLLQETAKGVAKRIEAALARTTTDTSKDGYQAIDGSWINLPPVQALFEEPTKPITEQDRAAAVARAATRRFKSDGDDAILNRVLGRIAALGPMDLVAEMAAKTEDGEIELSYILTSYRCNNADARHLVSQQPLKRKIEIAVACAINTQRNTIYLGTGPMSLRSGLTDWLATSDGDLRVIEQMIAPVLQPNAPKAGDQLFAALLDENEDPEELDPNAIWPFLANRVDELASRLMSARGPKQRHRIVTLMSMLPSLPQAVEPPLLEVARKDLGDGGRLAQTLLGVGEARWHVLLEGLLNDPDPNRREEAAFLIARVPGACDWDLRLRKAFETEQKEPVRIAILAARSALGADLSADLGADMLKKQAKAGLAKLRKPLPDWLALDALPPLTLADGTVLDQQVPRWWVAKAIALRRPQGDPLIDLWLGRLSQDSAQALGHHVLDAWIAEDTARRSPQQAAELAENAAQRTVQFHQQRLSHMQANPTRYSRPSDLPTVPDLDIERTRQLRRMRSEIIGSAIRQTGLLALTAHMDDAALARMVAPYLRSHLKRAPQVSALIDGLAHHAGRNAISAIVSALLGIKKKTLRDKAEARLKAIADERGWSVDELADRTAGTGGLDRQGYLQLPVDEDAGRTFTAQLADDFSIVLRNPNGKIVRALPARKDDTTKESRQLLAAVKKAVPKTIAMETMRLRQALTTQRTWTGLDWQAVFLDHPILRPMAQSLIWIKDATAFRPTPEGELLNAFDEEVQMDPDATVKLAHPITLGNTITQRWAELIIEDEISQPFDQLQRPVFGVPEGHPNRILDRQGWTVSGSLLVASASKLGWLQGGGGTFLIRQCNLQGDVLRARIDHGYYNSYEQAGSSVELGTLSFWRQESKRRFSLMPLSEVPSVLLSECQADLHAFAASGEEPTPQPLTGPVDP